MPEAPAHLVIDDDKAMRDACFQILSRQGYRVELAASAKQGLSLLERLSFDTILLDLVMPDLDGLEALKKIRALDPDVEVIIITGYGTIQSAVESIKAGAFHFLSKPFVPDDLRNLVSRALGKRRLDLENLYLRQELKIKDDRNTLVYESESMIRIMDMIARVAPTDSTVLITGESGTGKGLVARKIHQLSQRSRRPFITVDCGTLVETLFESELFGHVKGSFTGADANKIGKFELAQNGTLFFDEISNIGLEVQAKLLRAVEERKILQGGQPPGDHGGRAHHCRHQHRSPQGHQGRRLSRRPVLPPQCRHDPHAAVKGAEKRHSPAGPALFGEVQCPAAERDAGASPLTPWTCWCAMTGPAMCRSRKIPWSASWS